MNMMTARVDDLKSSNAGSVVALQRAYEFDSPINAGNSSSSALDIGLSRASIAYGTDFDEQLAQVTRRKHSPANTQTYRRSS